MSAAPSDPEAESAESRCAAPRAPSAGVVLVVDSEPLMRRALRRILAADGHRCVLACDPAEAAPALADPELDVVLLDLLFGTASGLDVLDHIKRVRPEIEVVMITGHATIESAVGCMRRGAFDYLEKPFGEIHRVRGTVSRALERRRLVKRNRELEQELRERSGSSDLVGNSAVMRSLLRSVRVLRHNESHVLIQGESGTGKELVARAIHEWSPRSSGPFVPIDCGALPESIIESELFGHEKGAFTGAVGATGLFRTAHSGTLFLDEVGELSPAIQAKLLRSLEAKEVRPVGVAGPVAVDLRVVSATRRDLAGMVEAGRFRADLFCRLNVVRLEVPPLRSRREDVPLLVHHFLAKHCNLACEVEGIEDDALELLSAADWPGNVRELEHAIESALALAPGPRLRACDLPLASPGPALATGEREDAFELSLDAYEKRAIERALRAARGDAGAAARSLGIGRSTFYRKLTKHGIVARDVRATVRRGPRGVGAPRSIG